ncbi:MAG TPA: DsbA family protein [Steroidobacteraceae bacterium]|nr:DsbA family protein [Steroidobacteraceae bacterium]
MRPISIAGRFQLCLLAVFTIGGIATLATAALSQELQEISRAGEKAILAKPGLQTAGARNPDLTIVEYFDYNCPFCKQVVPTFKQLLAEDKKLAIVYKDWPVLGESSVYAARCALAAGWQDKYLIAHDALLSGPRLRRNDQIEAILQGVGVDLDKLKKDLSAHAGEITALLARNDAEAHALDLDGTPGILVGRQLMPGGADVDFFRKLIAAVRSAPK